MARYDECKAAWDQRKAERLARKNAKFKAERLALKNPQHKADTATPPQEWRSGWVEIEDIETDAGGGNWLIERPELPQDALSFLKTLRVLGYHLQDQRYRDLHGELVLSDLIDRETGKWRHFNVNPEARSLFEQIEEVIASGVSEREALAQAIFDFDITGENFEAVHKRLERMLAEHRKRVRQIPAQKV